MPQLTVHPQLLSKPSHSSTSYCFGNIPVFTAVTFILLMSIFRLPWTHSLGHPVQYLTKRYLWYLLAVENLVVHALQIYFTRNSVSQAV